MSSISNKKVTKSNIYVPKYIKANNSNKINSMCSLILTEGDSAASLF